MRYFIHLGYDGSNYSGWQKQTEIRNTVQEVIEQALSQLFKKEIYVYGCGRTDAGVHASQYVTQINLDEAPTFDFKFRINKHLPKDISIFEIIPVNKDQHCRYDAVSRTYDYFIHWNKEPGLIRFSSFYEGLELDIDLTRKAIDLILQNKDFKQLCKQPESYNNTLCNISKCDLFINEEQGRLRFTITANRFLRGMVRICVFYLLEVGRGKMTLDDLSEILNQKKVLKEKSSAYPNGLFLSRIEYSNLELSDSNNLIKMLKNGLE